MAGREIIKKGLGWVIGDGSSVSVWGDQWLSTEQQLAPMGPATLEAQNLKVSDLISSEGNEWNLEMIRLHLPLYEKHIRRLVLSYRLMKDELVWLHERSGQDTTKIGYALSKLNVANDQENFKWRQWVWNLKCSPKLQHFLWKLKNEALAVGESLRKRGM